MQEDILWNAEYGVTVSPAKFSMFTKHVCLCLLFLDVFIFFSQTRSLTTDTDAKSVTDNYYMHMYVRFNESEPQF